MSWAEWAAKLRETGPQEMERAKQAEEEKARKAKLERDARREQHLRDLDDRRWGQAEGRKRRMREKWDKKRERDNLFYEFMDRIQPGCQWWAYILR